MKPIGTESFRADSAHYMEMKMNTRSNLAGLGIMLVGALLLGAASTANASVIRGPIAVIGSDFPTFGSPFTCCPIVNVINQSGLSVAYTSGVTDFGTYNATHSAIPFGDAFSASPSYPGNIDFDLGGSFNIEAFALWNDSQAGPVGRGINAFTIQTDDNSLFSSPTSAGTFNAVGFEVNTSLKQTFDLADSVGRYVRLRILSDHGDGELQFGEVAFETSDVTAMPEPATLALFGLGLAGLGFARRRKPA